MVELLLICITIILAGLAFDLQACHDCRIMKESLKKMARSVQKNEPEDDPTINLIGEEAYHEMTTRIETILKRHGHQACQTFNLTCGPGSAEGSRRLHEILPGCPVSLSLCSERGLIWIDIYSDGARIGRFALLDAIVINDIMAENHIRGAYVAEQNCYGIEDSLQLRIIIFYEPKSGHIDFHDHAAVPKNLSSHDLCLN